MKITLINNLKEFVKEFPLVAMAYRLIRDNLQLLRAPKETPLGFKLVGHYEMEQGLFEPKETELIKKILKKVDILINVGANIGYYCCIALKLNKYVVAFEPIPLNLQYLLKNLKANNWEEHIEIFPLALSNKIGIIEIYGGGTMASLVKGWGQSTLKQIVTLVPTSTMDIVLNSRFQDQRCLILVDIEGAEKLMLEGASTLLCAKPKHIWMVEISISEHQPNGININPNLLATFQLFWDKGYEAWTADNQGRQIFPEEIESIIKNTTDTLLTHNFLFIEKGGKAELLDD